MQQLYLIERKATEQAPWEWSTLTDQPLEHAAYDGWMQAWNVLDMLIGTSDPWSSGHYRVAAIVLDAEAPGGFRYAY